MIKFTKVSNRNPPLWYVVFTLGEIEWEFVAARQALELRTQGEVMVTIWQGDNVKRAIEILLNKAGVEWTFERFEAEYRQWHAEHSADRKEVLQ